MVWLVQTNGGYTARTDGASSVRVISWNGFVILCETPHWASVQNHNMDLFFSSDTNCHHKHPSFLKWLDVNLWALLAECRPLFGTVYKGQYNIQYYSSSSSGRYTGPCVRQCPFVNINSLKAKSAPFIPGAPDWPVSVTPLTPCWVKAIKTLLDKRSTCIEQETPALLQYVARLTLPLHRITEHTQ